MVGFFFFFKKKTTINSPAVDVWFFFKKKVSWDFPSLKAFKSRLNFPPALLGKYILV